MAEKVLGEDNRVWSSNIPFSFSIPLAKFPPHPPLFFFFRVCSGS